MLQDRLAFHKGLSDSSDPIEITGVQGQVLAITSQNYDARLMRSYPVSNRVNHVANDNEECTRSIEIAENQSRLFG
jgi:hypothetical protein